MKIYLCDPSKKGCCPSVEIKDDYVLISDDKNICKLTQKEWNILKQKIVDGL